MGNKVSRYNIEDNPNRKVFVEFKNWRIEESGYFGPYVVFVFEFRYQRYEWKIELRFNELIRLDRRLNREFPAELSQIQRPQKFNKWFWTQDEKFLVERSKIMTKYLQELLDIEPVINSNTARSLIGASVNSFRPEFGRKGKEGYLKKCSGGYLEKFSRKTGDYINVWKWRWIILTDNGIAWYKNPNSDQLCGLLQIDQDFNVVTIGRVLTVITATRRIIFYASTTRDAIEWKNEMMNFYSKSPRISRQFFDSSYPPRFNNEAKVYTITKDYYSALACALISAQKEILITSWKNSPGVLLTRPPLPSLRLDQLLKYKADQGVKIYILLYKEVEHIGQGNDSYAAKLKLEALSPNIQCIRHPNKWFGGSTAVLWSHHEKLVVIDRNMVFLGGVDLAFQRWDNERHSVVDEDGLIYPGNDYRQPATAAFKSVRNIDFENEANDSDEEMIEIEVALPGESLPQAFTAYADSEDQPYEVEVVVDFGIADDNDSKFNSPIIINDGHTDNCSQSSTSNSNNIMPNAPPLEQNESILGGEQQYPLLEDNEDKLSDMSENWAEDRYMEQTPEEKEAMSNGVDRSPDKSTARSSIYDSFKRLSMSQSSISSGVSSSVSYLSDQFKSYSSQATTIIKNYRDQMQTVKKLKKSGYWETRDLYPRIAWHDVQAVISGSAARDVASHFIQRWNHHRLSTASHDRDILEDITSDFNFATCARCRKTEISEREQFCPECGYDLGPINSYCAPFSLKTTPPILSEFSYICFEVKYSIKSKLPFRMQGDCPVVLTSIISSLNSNSQENADPEGSLIDIQGNQVEWLSAFGLYPAVGDIVIAVNDATVTHLNSNQIKRLIKRIKKGVSPLTGSEGGCVDIYKITFRRHYLENLAPLDKKPDPLNSSVLENPIVASNSQSPIRNSPIQSSFVDEKRALNPTYTEEPDLIVDSDEIIAEEQPVTPNPSPNSNVLNPQDFHPICQAAAHKEIQYSIAKLYCDDSKSLELINKLTNGSGTCKVQVLRSVGKWSIGTKTECSIQNCYVETIKSSLRLIYIENQFFVSSLAGDGVQNPIAQALLDRILLAVERREAFRVIMIIPLHPNGDFVNSMKSKVVMHYEYQTINRGVNSLLQQLIKRAPTINVNDYISIFSLRNWGVLNNKIVTDQIYVHDKVLIVDDRVMVIGSANINDRSMLGHRDSEIALRFEDTLHFESVLNSSPHTVGYLPFSTRMQLMRQHIGQDDSIDLTDPLNPRTFAQLRSIASSNSAIYDEMDGNLSVYRCNHSAEYKIALQNYNHKSYLDEQVRTSLAEIKGFLVDWPQSLYKNEDLSPSIATRALIPNELWV